MADVAPPSFKKRSNKSSNIRKRPATPPPDSDSDSDSYTDDEAGVRVKRRKKEGLNISSTAAQATQDFSKSTKYAADRSTTIAVNDDATKASNWYTDAAIAADASSKTATVSSKPTPEVNGASEGGYKGTTTYGSFIQKNPNTAQKQVGPVKAPTNIRTITVTDFAPDVCKDYKQTGFCGFGDSCKFLHAREDYKQGWQLDKEWESAGKKKSDPNSKPNEELDDEAKLLEGIPFKCIICKDDYKNPVTTKCGHYFCERCAMGRYAKEKKKTCANCGADTGGSYSVARKLKGLLERKKVREEEREAEKNGEED